MNLSDLLALLGGRAAAGQPLPGAGFLGSAPPQADPTPVVQPAQSMPAPVVPSAADRPLDPATADALNQLGIGPDSAPAAPSPTAKRLLASDDSGGEMSPRAQALVTAPRRNMIGDVLDMLAGSPVAAAHRRQAQADQAAFLQSQIMSIKDPKERLLASLDPAGYAKALGTQFSFHDVEGGHSYGAGSDMRIAPKLIQEGDQTGTQYGDQPTVWTGTRAPTIAETETGRHDLATEAETARKDSGDMLTKGAPTGSRVTLGADGLPSAWSMDPAYQAFELKKAASGATKVSVSTPVTVAAQNDYGKTLAELNAKALDKARDEATNAQQAMVTLRRIRGNIPNANTGAFAGVAQGVDAVASALGSHRAQARAASTQQLDSDLNALVLPMVKNLGSSNSITDADRDFTAKIVGKKDLTPQALDRIMQIQQRDAEAKISRFRSLGREAYAAVPAAQGLPASAFGGQPLRGGPVPAAPLRQKGATYSTPRGQMTWTGTGWVPAAQ